MPAADIAASFAELLDPHVERVNDFYMERVEEGVILLHELANHVNQLVCMLDLLNMLCGPRLLVASLSSLTFGLPPPSFARQSAGHGSPEFRTACQRSLVAIHFQLLLLQHYVALNFTAIAKILKKFEKRIGVPIRNDYIAAIVDLPFYRCSALGELVEETERQFHALEALSGRGGSCSSSGAGGVSSEATPTTHTPPPPRPMPPVAQAPTGMAAYAPASGKAPLHAAHVVPMEQTAV